jgi:hypothetical protein
VTVGGRPHVVPCCFVLAGAPVEVVLAVDERTDVLLASVTALLALADGGYSLEVVADDGTTTIVRVETGLFAEDKVEVSDVDRSLAFRVNM